MRALKSFVLIILLGVHLLSCTQNIFSEMASKSSDDSLLYEARKFVDLLEYQSAINIITSQISTQGQTRADVKEVLASAYGGLCGLNFINFTNSISQQTSGTAFNILAAPFIGVAVQPDDCLTALDTLNSIGDTNQRTSYQNALASLLGMALMGAATREYTDSTPALGDGTQDSAGVSCSLTDEQVDQIVLGFGNMSKNFSYLSTAQLGSSSQGTLDGVINTCQTVAGADCEITDASLITTEIRDTIKDLMNTSDFGVGTVVTGGDPLLIGASCP